MSNKQKYTLYTLQKNVLDGRFKWYATKYTRTGLSHRIAISIRNGHSIIDSDNFSEDMSEISISGVVIRSSNSLFGYYTDWNYIYAIRNPSGQLLKLAETAEFKEDIKSELLKIEKQRAKIQKEREYREKSEAYKFRYDPVPHVHKPRGGSYYRHPKIHRIMVQSSITEYKRFASPDERKVNMPEWDDRPRDISHSWKDSSRSKARKSWQRNAKSSLAAYSLFKQYDETWEQDQEQLLEQDWQDLQN